MKDGREKLRDEAENPFLRAPDSPFYIRQPLKPGASKADLLHRLKSSLAQMSTLCFDREATLRPGETSWPSEPWLDELSEIIRRLSSLHQRGGKDLWSRIKAIDNRYGTLKLSAKIQKLVDRAGKLYREPAAIAIQRQALAGNQAAYHCFVALKRCRDGKSEIASENWSEYRETLQPRPAESCEAKAAQLVIDWLRDDRSPQKPSDHLASWLSTIGNPSLAAKLMRPDDANLRLVFWIREANKTQRLLLFAPEKIPPANEECPATQHAAHSRHSGRADSEGQSKKVSLSSHQ